MADINISVDGLQESQQLLEEAKIETEDSIDRESDSFNDEFDRAASYVIQKNAELYRRLV